MSITIPASAIQAAAEAFDSFSLNAPDSVVFESVIRAALNELLQPACWRGHQPNHTSSWHPGVAPVQSAFSQKGWSIEQAYTLKGQ